MYFYLFPGGTRMRYPSSYVLLTADTEAEILQLQPHPSATPNVHLSSVHHPNNLPPGEFFLALNLYILINPKTHKKV